MPTQRITVVAPETFNPDTDEHVLINHLTGRYGTGWRIDAYDPDTRTCSASRHRERLVPERPATQTEPDPAHAAVLRGGVELAS